MSLDPAARTRIRPADAAVFVVMFAAATMALGPHLFRSAFYDEAWVIESAVAPTVSEGWALLLNGKSPAAAGYVAGLHHAVALTGATVPAFRTIEATLAVITVLLAMGLAYTWGRSGVAIIAAAAGLLLMPMFQRYGTEIKQYILEAALTLAMILAVQVWVTGSSHRRQQAAWCWFVLAAIAILATFAGWFSVAGTGLVAGLFLLKQRDVPQVRRALLFALAIACLAAVIHTQFNKHIASSSSLEGYWIDYYLPLDSTWFATAWSSLSTLLKNCWFRYERFPGGEMLVLVIVGMAAWIKYQPASGLAALAVVIVTLAASTAKAWPLNLRVNLHMLVIMHIAAVAGPVLLASWQWHRWAPMRFFVPPASKVVPWVVVLGAVGVGGLIWHESRSGDYEIAAVDKLLDQTAKVAGAGDIVVLLPAARVNQMIAPRAIAGTIRSGPWAARESVVGDYLPLVALGSQRPVLFAVSHHHGGVVEAFKELGQALSPFGRFTVTWSDRFVAIYRFDPKPR